MEDWHDLSIFSSHPFIHASVYPSSPPTHSSTSPIHPPVRYPSTNPSTLLVIHPPRGPSTHLLTHLPIIHPGSNYRRWWRECGFLAAISRVGRGIQVKLLRLYMRLFSRILEKDFSVKCAGRNKVKGTGHCWFPLNRSGKSGHGWGALRPDTDRWEHRRIWDADEAKFD